MLHIRAEELKGHLDAMLLAALEGGPRHGYAVIEALRQSTDGRLDLPTGTIYPALRRLEQAGLIAGTWSVVGGRRRRVPADSGRHPGAVRPAGGLAGLLGHRDRRPGEQGPGERSPGGHGMPESEPRRFARVNRPGRPPAGYPGWGRWWAAAGWRRWR